MTPTPTPGAAAELPVIYVGKIAEGQTLFMPRASLDKSALVALTPHAPAQSQLDALREEVAKLKESRDDLHNALHGERDRTDAYVSKLHAEFAALKAQPTDVDAVMALADEYATWFFQYTTFGGQDKRTRSEAAREALRAKLAARKEPK